MTLNIIITYKSQPQEFMDIQGGLFEMFESEAKLARILLGFAKLENQKEVVKISTCITAPTGFTEYDLPKWFVKNNGKFWFSNGVYEK